jgi:probable rRNA maturation factor
VILVEIANCQRRLRLDRKRIARGVRAALRLTGKRRAAVSVAIVDTATIHELNRRHLAHDYPTDVLSFLLGDEDGWIEGEVIVSADAAAESARRFGWKPADELLLYVVHGTLHLAGFDDTTRTALRRMRKAEREVLSKFGLTPAYDGEPLD